MAVVATQATPLDGAALTYSAASLDGDRFTPSSRTFMHIRNDGAASITATLTTPNTVDGLAIADRTVTVPAGTDRIVALPKAAYASGDGLGDVSWSDDTSVSFAVVLATP